MTFEEFCYSLADAVEQAVEDDGGESPCYLCHVLSGAVTTPEKQARGYLPCWDAAHVETLLLRIQDAENRKGCTFRGLLEKEYWGTVGYHGRGSFGNPARIHWLREGAPIFWEE